MLGALGTRGTDGTIGSLRPWCAFGTDGAIPPLGALGTRGTDGTIGSLRPRCAFGTIGTLGPRCAFGTDGAIGTDHAFAAVGTRGTFRAIGARCTLRTVAAAETIATRSTGGAAVPFAASGGSAAGRTIPALTASGGSAAGRTIPAFTASGGSAAAGRSGPSGGAAALVAFLASRGALAGGARRRRSGTLAGLALALLHGGNLPFMAEIRGLDSPKRAVRPWVLAATSPWPPLRLACCTEKELRGVVLKLHGVPGAKLWAGVGATGDLDLLFVSLPLFPADTVAHDNALEEAPFFAVARLEIPWQAVPFGAAPVASRGACEAHARRSRSTPGAPRRNTVCSVP